MTKPIDTENATLHIELDETIAVVVKVPKKMKPMDFAGFMTKMNFMKNIAKQNLVSTEMTVRAAMHKWTPEEKAFLQKNPDMKIPDIRKHLKGLGEVKDASIYAMKASLKEKKQ